MTSDTDQDSAADARIWVERSRAVLEEAYGRFVDTGDWPGVADLQRFFDRRGDALDVQEVIDSKPRVLHEARLAHPDRIVLQLRHLMWISTASELVELCLLAIRRAVTSYLSDDDVPGISSAHIFDTGNDAKKESPLMSRIYSILSHEYPSPFAGSGVYPDGSWHMDVDSRFARRFRDIDSIAAFVARQDSIRAGIAREALRLGAPLGFAVDDLKPTLLADNFTEPGYVGPEEDKGVQPVLFLSWGRTVSRAVADALKPILESRLPGVEVFFSPTSIEPGADPSRRMFDEGLLRCSALVVVVTRDSAESPYVIWETATGWARDQLVIPVFVDIEPGSVPGPLTSRVQGVHLSDKLDMDRGLVSLCSRFGAPPATPLTDEEHESLLTAAGVPTATPTTERDSLMTQLRGYVARWRVLYESLDGVPSVDERVRLAAEIHQVLTEAVRAALVEADDPSLAEDLSQIAKRAAAVMRTQVYLDGGKSFSELDDGCRGLIEIVEARLE